MLRKLAVGRDFDATDDRAVLSLPHRMKHMERHSYLVREGDPASYCCVMLSGFAIRHKFVGDGSRQILALHMKGDLVDLQNSLLGIADHSVQLLTNATVAFIPAAAIKQLAFERPNVGAAMWLDTLVDASVFREWIANVGRRDAHTRIAHLLCEFAIRLKVAGLAGALEYELPMTQQQIADCVGLTTVHVNRTLKMLEVEGLITRHSSRAMIIGDWKKLAKAGDFDSGYLHLPDKRMSLA
jgi:CRP-like cAMP-binding protein